MPHDPIVAEVRAAGEELARRTGNNVHRFFAHLRRKQRGCKGRLVARVRASRRAGLPL
jgi:hypothetical protein